MPKLPHKQQGQKSPVFDSRLPNCAFHEISGCAFLHNSHNPCPKRIPFIEPKGDTQLMRKIAITSIFIFLTGLFAGLFFSTNLSEANNSYLSTLLLSGIASSSAGFFQAFLSSLLSNLPLVALMMAAMFSHLFCPVPLLVLWFKSFAIGFCSGLVYLNAPGNAFSISLLKIFPQNLFLIPAFITLATLTFYISYEKMSKKNRPGRERQSLQRAIFISCTVIVAGCLTEALCHLIALSP